MWRVSLVFALVVHGPAVFAHIRLDLPIEQVQRFEEEIVPQRYVDHPGVNAFIHEIAARYDFDAQALHLLFARTHYSATAVKLVMPAAVPDQRNWQLYRSRFLNDAYINAGARFWRTHQAALQRAYQEFGVPPEIIVAIIGIESLYGHRMGNFRVLDVLTTLAFDYPPTPNRLERSWLFRKNLEDFLIWTRNAELDPTHILGSYAGAIGIPQFMPSSILQYAIGYGSENLPDLRTSAADSIGSIANYLRQHGWEADRPIVWNIGLDAGSQGIAQAAANGYPEPDRTLEQLLKAGLLLNEAFIDTHAELGTPVTVVDLPTPGQPVEYLLGLRNFYVITRYNKSFFYAAAVYQLSQRIKQRASHHITQNS